MGHRILAEFKQPSMNDSIGEDVVIGQVSEKFMETDHICDARMETKVIQGSRESSKPC